MKQSDIITAGIMAVVGVIISCLLCNVFLEDLDKKTVSFSTIEEISSDLQEPNAEVFNSEAINPTVEVYVGECEDWDRNGMIDNAEWLACHENSEE